jgi:hypothetical protein
MKPTVQAAATNAAIPYSAIATADTLTLSFFGVGTGYTPTASEVYGIRTARIAPAAPLLLFTQSLAPVSVAAADLRGADLHGHAGTLDRRFAGVGEQAEPAGGSVDHPACGCRRRARSRSTSAT